jgi:hypothetical protein
LTLPADLPAGVHTVQVAQMQQMGLGSPPPFHRGVESQAVPFVLCPTISQPVTVVVTDGVGPGTPRKGRVTVTLTPPVGASQRVTLLLNELLPPPPPPSPRPPNAYRFSLPPNQPGVVYPTNTLQIGFSGVLPATYLVRVQVDGAESPLTVDQATGRYIDPKAVIP